MVSRSDWVGVSFNRFVEEMIYLDDADVRLETEPGRYGSRF